MLDGRTDTIARATAAVGCTLVLALAATTIANTQAKSGADQQIAALQQQLTALDRRVKELEKTASNASGPDDPGPVNRIKNLEDQVRRLEAEQQAHGAKPAGSPEQSAVRLTAPFTVVDSAGKLLMRVTDQGNGFSRGTYLYDGNEKIVGYIGGDTSGGRVYATKNGLLPQAMIAATDTPEVYLRGPQQKAGMTIDPVSMAFYGDSGSPLSVFGTKDRLKGYMELNDGSGSKMVEAGMLNSHVGYVMANPSRSSVGVTGNPSVLMGGAGR